MPKQLLPLITAAVAPTVAADATAGYFVGQTWLNTATNTLYICTGVGTGAATWVVILASSSSVATSTIQGRVTAGTGPIETLTTAQVKTLLAYTVTDLAAVPATRTVIAGTGLTGGGALSADITLTVAYGVTGTTACVGNDSRLSNSRAPTAHAISLVTAANTARFFGRITAAGGVGEELTGAQATTLLSVVVGDGGAGGAKGLVPAPAAGDAAANKVLGAGGSWIAQASAGTVVSPSRSILSGTGLSGGGDLSADRTLAVLYGGTSSTACIGNDARLSDARTPTAHVLDSASHTISGKTAGQVLIATAATTFAFTTISGDATLSSTGVLTISAAAVTLAKIANIATNTLLGRTTAATGVVENITVSTGLTFSALALSVAYGSTASTACIGNDARLSDTRTPTAHVLDSGSHTISGKTAGQVLLATTATTFAFTTISGDATLSGAGVLTVANSAVTLAKIANITTARILGRVTAATGVVEELTGANVRTICVLATTDSPAFAGLSLTGAATINVASGTIQTWQLASVTRMILDGSGNLGINVTPTASNGLLQFPAGTTKANGIAFGTDVFCYRTAANALRFDGVTNTNSVFLLVSSGTGGSFFNLGSDGGTWELSSNAAGNFSITANGVAADVFNCVRTGSISNTLVLNAGRATFGGTVQVNKYLNVGAFTTPASTSAAGVSGDMTFDQNYIYVCYATNSWKRVLLATW